MKLVATCFARISIADQTADAAAEKARRRERDDALTVCLRARHVVFLISCEHSVSNELAIFVQYILSTDLQNIFLRCGNLTLFPIIKRAQELFISLLFSDERTQMAIHAILAKVVLATR
jgi:hypothetical protein